MELHALLLSLGILLLVGLAADEIGRRTRLPRVTLLIVFGVVVGPSVLDLLPQAFQDLYTFLTSVALTMVAFLLGGQLSITSLYKHGRVILFVSMAAVVLTALIVGVGLLAIGAPVVIALLFAGIGTATAPAATHDIVHQSRAKGPVTKTLLGGVAVDDAWGLIVFSFLLIVAKAAAGDGAAHVMTEGLREFAGAIAIGLVVGLPAAYLTGRLGKGEPAQTEALGIVFLCAGLAIWLEVSFLIAGMVAGAVVINLARHHRRPFHEIEHIEWPFMVFFFILAGASLDLGSLGAIGAIGVAYVVLRTFGRVLGGWAGARLGGAPKTHQRWIGLALVPQAGVALGMALVAASHFPDYAEMIVAITVGTTIIFEIFGPLLTQRALSAVGEATR